MEQIYDVVPDIISGKDLDYLTDMFNWNYGAYKNTYNSLNSVNDVELRNVLSKALDTFSNNINNILNILCNGGKHE